MEWAQRKKQRSFWPVIYVLSLLIISTFQSYGSEPASQATSNDQQILLENLPDKPQISKEQALYDQCISVLKNITGSTSSKQQSHLGASKYSDGNNDMAVMIWQYLSRIVWSSTLQDNRRLGVYVEPEDLPSELLLFDEKSGIPHFTPDDSPRSKRIKATKGLMIAALGMASQDALMALGDMYLFGKYNTPRNATLAFNYYNILSERYGNATAQSRLGFMYSVGVGVSRDYPKALVYTSFAAVGGDATAEQTLGYYHQVGIAAPKNCEEAAFYYKRAADKAMAKYKSGPPGGLQLPHTRTRLYDAEGGVYGQGASGAGNPQQYSQNGYLWTPQEALQYHHYSADRPDGDITSQVLLGQTYYTGAAHVEQDFTKAFIYFRKAAKQYPDHAIAAIQQAQSRGEPIPQLTPSQQTRATLAANAAGYLGRMYWRGEGVEQNNATARWYFERGAKQDDGASHTGLGMMYELGIAGLPVDLSKAQNHFIKATELMDADGRVYLGELLLKRKMPDYTAAFKVFAEAVKQGHVYAHYRVGEMMIDGMGTQKNCPVGVSYLKMVVERADWHDPVVHEAENALKSGDVELALLKYLMAAERGYDVGQMNAVWLIDQGKYDPSKSRLFKNDRNAFEVALILWNRAANQGNVDARVKMGDYYYYGLGTSSKNSNDESETTPLSGSSELKHEPMLRQSSPLLPVAKMLHLLGLTWLIPPALKSELLYVRGHPDYERAALYYQVAAESEFSAMAMWNLGWMHELGIGVERDYHLAKRFYDRALQTNPEAYFPVNLCLVRLYVKWWFYAIFSPSSIASAGYTHSSSLYATKLGSDNPLETTQLGRDGLPSEDPYLDELEEDGESWGWDSFWGQDGENPQEPIESMILFGLLLIAFTLWWWRQALNHNGRMHRR